MKALKKTKIILCFLIFCQAKVYSQEFLVINKNNFKTFDIQTISDLNSTPIGNCNCANIDSCAHTYFFKDGKLIRESFYNDLNEKVYTDEYYYFGDKLKTRTKDLGGGQEKHTINYQYKNGKMVSSVTTHSLYYLDKDGYYTSVDTYEDFYKYSYDSENRLERRTMFNSEDSRTMIDSTKYYLYKENSLIGYYPAKNENEITNQAADSIYYTGKLIELNRIGLDSFSKKYFNESIYRKIVNDCYKHISNNEFLINGHPVKEFLIKIGKVDSQYIVLEVADNYFLFYKLTD